MFENVLRFCLFGSELSWKRIVWKVGLSLWTIKKQNFQIFEAMVLKLCKGYLVHITECVWILFAISSIRARIMGKRVFFSKVGLSHFFYVEANVKVSYMGTFIEAMVLKPCIGYLVHIRECVWKFFAISSIRSRIMGKRVFFQKWDLVIFSTLRQM